MKVGIFLQGNNTDYLAMMRMSIASVRKSMPGVEIHHFTDTHTAPINGVDGTVAISGAMPMAVRRMTANSQCEGDWLFIDCDVIVQKDVRAVFEDAAFDVALTDRSGTITNEAKYAAVMPHNIGVTFSRSPAFWKTVLEYLKKLPLKLQEWEGDQRIVNAIVAAGGVGFNIKIVPGLLYNYPPRSADDPRISEASIVHYKGNRKTFILKEAA